MLPELVLWAPRFAATGYLAFAREVRLDNAFKFFLSRPPPVFGGRLFQFFSVHGVHGERLLGIFDPLGVIGVFDPDHVGHMAGREFRMMDFLDVNLAKP